MEDVDNMNSLLKQLQKEWESQKMKCLSQIRNLEEENATLRKRKRKSKTCGCFGKKKKEPLNKTGLSSADEEDGEESSSKLPQLICKIGNIHEDLERRYFEALKQLEEQKRRNQQKDGGKLRDSKSPGGGHSSQSAHYNKSEWDGISTFRPAAEIRMRTTVSQSRNHTEITDFPAPENRTTCSEKRQSCVPRTRKEVPRRSNGTIKSDVSKKVSPTTKRYESIDEEISKDEKPLMEAEGQRHRRECVVERDIDAEREGHRLEIKALTVEMEEKKEYIETLRTMIKVKDAQIVHLSNIIYVVKKLKFRK